MASLLSGAPAQRHLTTTKVLPYSPSTIFNVFSDIASYHEFSTSISSSTVTSKDSSSLPTDAKLKVGYPPLGLEEEWPCRVKCNHNSGLVQAQNAPADEGGSGSAVLEVWIVKWTITPALSASEKKQEATVRLDLELKFRNSVVDGMFSVLPRVAEKMMIKFETRVGEVHEKEEKKRTELEKQQKKAAKAVDTTPRAEKEASKKNANGVPKKLEIRSNSVKPIVRFLKQ
ncbi:hypothetical protein MBLNU457_1627t1 [Dothideomycetes sp. NU457]